MGNVHVAGISEDQARSIALTVFHENFIRLGQDAADLAAGRAQRLVDDYIKAQHEKAADDLAQVADPDFLSALFQAQKAYARTGDQDLELLLVDMLVSRASEKGRNLRQIVLNEAIEVASKLTQSQIDLLTVIFMLRNVTLQPGNVASVAQYLTNHFVRHADLLIADSNVYTYLDYAGAARVQITSASFSGLMIHHFCGFLSKGFSNEEAQDLTRLDYRVAPLLRKSARTPGLVELDVVNKEHLITRMEAIGLPKAVQEKLTQKLEPLLIDDAAKLEYLDALAPGTRRFGEAWDACDIKSATLTAVGIAIAHSNTKRSGINIPTLSTWIR